MDNLVFRGADNRALTNSLLVAEKFGKEHGDVLKAIDAVFTKVPENQCKGYFSDTSIEIPQPNDVSLNNGTGGIKKAPMYVMNRDGFTLLVMGFTGKRAFQFKLAYIAAFNAMEKTIKEDYTRALSNMDQRIKVLEEKYSSENELSYLLRLTPGISLRDSIQYLIDDCAERMKVSKKNLWYEIFRQLHSRYHISFSSCERHPKEKVLDLVDRYGLLIRVYVVALDMYDMIMRSMTLQKGHESIKMYNK